MNKRMIMILVACQLLAILNVVILGAHPLHLLAPWIGFVAGACGAQVYWWLRR